MQLSTDSFMTEHTKCCSSCMQDQGGPMLPCNAYQVISSHINDTAQDRVVHPCSAASHTPTQHHERAWLVKRSQGLVLTNGILELHIDFSSLLRRCKPHALGADLLIKACKFKSVDPYSLTALDGCAGLGEDAFILASWGYHVDVCEHNPMIFELLHDAWQRALNEPETHAIARRMHLYCTDSTRLMEQKQSFDLVYLDPMFPTKTKTSQARKKFQLLHLIEQPCTTEEHLLSCALASKAKKVVVKRPIKGAPLNNTQPSYTIKGTAIRYDCYRQA